MFSDGGIKPGNSVTSYQDPIMAWLVAAEGLVIRPGETMPDPHAKDNQAQLDIQAITTPQERRAQARADSVLGQIEDVTYAILRKHENESA